MARTRYQVESEPVVVWIYCIHDLLFASLSTLGATAGLKICRITPAFIAKAEERIFPSLVVWVHDEREAESVDLTTRLLASHSSGIDWVLVGIDDPKGQERATQEGIQARFPRVHCLRYHHVVVPQPPEISSVQRVILDTVTGVSPHTIQGILYPLWYEDVAAHMIESLFRIGHCDGEYRGKEGVKSAQYLLAYETLLGVAAERAGTVGPAYRIRPLELLASIPSRSWEECRHLLSAHGIAQSYASLYESGKNTTTAPLNAPKSGATQASGKLVIPSQSRQKRRGRRLRVGLVLAILPFVGYGLAVLILMQLSAQARMYYQDLLATGQGEGNGQQALQIVAQVTQRLPFPYHVMGLPAQSSAREGLVKTLTLFADGMSLSTGSQERVYTLYRNLSSGIQENSRITDIQSSLDETYRVFSLLAVRLGPVREPLTVFLGSAEALENVVNQVSQIRQQAVTLRTLSDGFTTILGFQTPQTYAIALLDSHALRGSGGRVVAVALLTLDRGHIKERVVYSTEELNEKLPGSVLPPSDVTRFTGATNWGIADASWSPSATQASSHILWFLQRQTGKTLSGLVTIPTSTLTRLLAPLGPLSLSVGTLSAENTTLVLSQLATASGASRSTVFVAVIRHLTTQMFALSQQGMGHAFQTLATELSSGNITVNVTDPQVQQIFRGLSWTGEILVPPCPQSFQTTPCTVSSLYVSENSLSGKALPQLITRSHAHTVSVRSDILIHERQVTINNPNDSEYTAVFSGVVTGLTNVQEVSVNGTPVPISQLLVTTQDAVHTIMFPFGVPPQGTTVVRLVYTSPGLAQEHASLVFVDQKQPGVSGEPLVLTIAYPDSYTAKTVAPRPTVERGKLVFQATRDKNLIFGVSF